MTGWRWIKIQIQDSLFAAISFAIDGSGDAHQDSWEPISHKEDVPMFKAMCVEDLNYHQVELHTFQ